MKFSGLRITGFCTVLDVDSVIAVPFLGQGDLAVRTYDGYLKLGHEIKRCRLDRGWTLEELSGALEHAGLERGNSRQHLSEIERAQGKPSVDLIEALDDLFHAGQKLVNLLRDAKVPARQKAASSSIRVRAHLFFPVVVSDLPDTEPCQSLADVWLVDDIGEHTCTEGSSSIYTFPFDVVVVHERHELQTASLTEVSLWRSQQIERAEGAARGHLAEQFTWDGEVLDNEPYCLTCFELLDGPWDDEVSFDRAVQILSNPSTLSRLGETDHDKALRTEASLLSHHKPIGDLHSFGISDSYVGFASWASVAVLDIASEHGIGEKMVNLEVQLQALWCYSFNVEHHRRWISADYDAGFLRRSLRSIQRPSPREHTSARLLREAVVRTSRIEETIAGALDISTTRSRRK